MLNAKGLGFLAWGWALVPGQSGDLRPGVDCSILFIAAIRCDRHSSPGRLDNTVSAQTNLAGTATRVWRL